MTVTGEHSSGGSDPQPPARRPEGRKAPRWRALLVPRLTNTQLIVFVLCAALGFGVVVQVRQTNDDALAGMRQDDLVRLLDELTRRNTDLADEQQQLRADLGELRSSSSSREAAAAAAAEQARVQGVLAGTLPVRGPGIRLTIKDPQGGVRAQTLVTILEELRNAGAESVELLRAADHGLELDPGRRRRGGRRGRRDPLTAVRVGGDRRPGDDGRRPRHPRWGARRGPQRRWRGRRRRGRGAGDHLGAAARGAGARKPGPRQRRRVMPRGTCAARTSRVGGSTVGARTRP
ncbi:DUF881 domain-containing protein [Georgenia yuyongxinii]